jgi:hypothetical protein
MDPIPIENFQPKTNFYLKYGLCAPAVCSKHDIANLLNSFIDRLALNITEKPHINTTYIQIQQDKTLDSSAISTL